MAGKYCFLLHNSYYVPDSISDNERTESVPGVQGSSCFSGTSLRFSRLER